MANGSNSSLGGSLIVAAIVVGLSVISGSFLIKTGFDENASKLTAVLGEMQALTAKIAAAPSAARPTPTARAGRPDPAKVYQVALGDAPTKGTKAARVKIVEWSDFQ